MDKQEEAKELRKKLRAIEKEYYGDWEVVHSRQDDALLDYIDDSIVTKIFNGTEKWCA